MMMASSNTPLLRARGLSKLYNGRGGCVGVDLDVYPGEVLCIVGESGSGKSTLLNALALRSAVNSGSLEYRTSEGEVLDLLTLSEQRRRLLSRTDWGFVHQNARDGLRSGVSAGANIGEPLMAVGARHYGRLRDAASAWGILRRHAATLADRAQSGHATTSCLHG